MFEVFKLHNELPEESLVIPMKMHWGSEDYAKSILITTSQKL